ncbi:sulfurtransferase TusA, partial [Glaesserella parasuis]
LLKSQTDTKPYQYWVKKGLDHL